MPYSRVLAKASTGSLATALCIFWSVLTRNSVSPGTLNKGAGYDLDSLPFTRPRPIQHLLDAVIRA